MRYDKYDKIMRQVDSFSGTYSLPALYVDTLP